MEGSLQCINGSLWCLRLAEWQWLHWHASTIHNIEHQHNAQYTMHNVPDQITLYSVALLCNMYSDALLHTFALLCLCSLDNTQCNMQHALCCSALQQITRMFAPQWVALMACWGPLCLGDNDNDIANISISIETPLLNVTRLPSQLGRQWHCQCLNLYRNTSPQCH